MKRRGVRVRNERGVQSLELTVWVAMASLVCAGVPQAVGYYRQTALSYTMRADAERIGAIAESAKVGLTTLSDDVTDTDTVFREDSANQASLLPSEDGSFVVVITNPDVQRDVVYSSCNNTARGLKHGINVVPKGSVHP